MNHVIEDTSDAEGLNHLANGMSLITCDKPLCIRNVASQVAVSGGRNRGAGGGLEPPHFYERGGRAPPVLLQLITC
jgi:hypothetical protein